MATIFDKLKWVYFQMKYKTMTVNGLKNGMIFPYSDKIIERFRKVYYGGIPASIILLSNGMTNGYCYDRALLASRAFLDDEDYDVSLLYASINSLRLNPQYVDDKSPMKSDHCIVEITQTLDGSSLIIDTSSGFIYDKDLYWKMEKPQIRHKNDKEKIKQFLAEDEEFHPENIENDKYIAPLVIPNIERTFGRPTEMYSMLGIELLQREIEHYKNVIDYDAIKQELDDGVQRLASKKTQVVSQYERKDNSCEDVFSYRIKGTETSQSGNNVLNINRETNSSALEDRE